MRLNTYYKSRVIYRIGSACEMKYKIEDDKSRDIADMAIYINEKLRIAVVWNLQDRRKNNQSINTLSVNCKWENALPDRKLIRAYYKKMGTCTIAPLEKVLILDVDILDEILEDLFLYLQMNSLDTEYPVDKRKVQDVLPEEIRERVSTSRWERNHKFRDMILKHYKYRCAICRCDEPKLLQAAHITAVADGGKDTIDNGICLCANHHIMLDKELLKINYKTKELSYVDGKMKKMSWYGEFMNTYNGKIL